MNHDTLVDVFFTVTGIAVGIITVLLAAGLIYLIIIFRTIKRIVKTAEFASEVLKEDVMELRNNIKSKGFTLSAFTGFLTKLAKTKILPRAKKK